VNKSESAERKLFLHIGMPKTGTTALQTFLATHSDALARYGVVFPSAGRRQNQHFFLAAHKAENPNQCAQAWSELYKELDAQPWTTALLSSERFCYSDPDEVYTACSKLQAETHLVLFLRKREILIESSYRTAVKTWPRVC